METIENGQNHISKRPEKTPRDITLDDLEISIRTYQFLKNAGIMTLEDIVSHELDFYSTDNIRGFTKRNKDELVDVVQSKGLKFKDQE